MTRPNMGPLTPRQQAELDHEREVAFAEISKSAKEQDAVDSVLIILKVPRRWRRLSESEVARALKYNQPELLPGLAAEIKRWQGVGAVDLTELRKMLEEREAIENV